MWHFFQGTKDSFFFRMTLIHVIYFQMTGWHLFLGKKARDAFSRCLLFGCFIFRASFYPRKKGTCFFPRDFFPDTVLTHTVRKQTEKLKTLFSWNDRKNVDITQCVIDKTKRKFENKGATFFYTLCNFKQIILICISNG